MGKIFSFLMLIIILSSAVNADEYNCFSGDGLKQKLNNFSMNLWPQHKGIDSLGIYNWTKYNNEEVLQISLDKIPPKYSLNMISKRSGECLERLKTAGKIKIQVRYAFLTKSENLKDAPYLSLRVSSNDWKKMDKVLNLRLENSDAPETVKVLSINSLKIPEWAQEADWKIYASNVDGSLILKDISITIEDGPNIVFPDGNIISSKHGGKGFYILKKNVINDTDKIRIIIMNENMTIMKKIETSLLEPECIKPPDAPGFYWISACVVSGKELEKEVVPKTLFYIYE